jgi:sugar phosphate isomerase/epimerase
MRYTRREVGTLALVSVPLLSGWRPHPFSPQGGARPRPNSTVNGVRIGMNVPYNFGSRTMSGDETLDRCLQLGVSAVELRSQPVEIAMGSPGFAPAGEQSPGRGAAAGQQQAVTESVRQWRASVPLTTAEAFRRTWDRAGVAIEIVKFDGVYSMSDDEVDFAFRLAKALGARAISTEIARPDISQTRRIGQFADRHGIMVGYHGHTETGPADWETAFSYARHNGANLDIGHYVAGHNTSPVPFLKAHHDRITHIHVKDRRLGTKGGDNVPFGQGDTPIGEILRLIRDNRWNIQATIEFEYPVPDGSDRMAEMRKCIEFCRTQLQT